MVRNSCAEEEDRGMFQEWEETKNSSEMQKPSKAVRYTLLNGSAWGSDKKYMRRYKSTFDIFFGIEHRTTKEQMEEQFNKETNQV